jgi:hypothetical protein
MEDGELESEGLVERSMLKVGEKGGREEGREMQG